MNSVLDDEILSINAIYGENTLRPKGESDAGDDVFILRVPSCHISLRLVFAADYPEQNPPVIQGSETSGGSESKKGKASEVVALARETLSSCFRRGEACIYDLLEELGQKLESQAGALGEEHTDSDSIHQEHDPGHGSQQRQGAVMQAEPSQMHDVDPPWVLSELLSEKKSVFLARAAHVDSVEESQLFISHLVATDKKAAKATHNISAWRIKGATDNIVFQDSDDDGETAAGSRLLHLLQLMNAWNVVIVVSRWYGGIQLGPARFSIINSVARDALVKGKFVDVSSK